MGVVGGSRHYAGGGLGAEGIWECPSCGEENSGPMAQGCTRCGAGQPGIRVTAPPPAPPAATPRVSERAPDDPTYAPERLDPHADREDNLATRWIERHPDATLEDAFTAGYIEGVREARRAQLADEARRRPPVADAGLPIAERTTRTLIAALQLFAEQVLAERPPEVESGEWCSVEDVAQIVRELQQGLTQQEAVHG